MGTGKGLGFTKKDMQIGVRDVRFGQSWLRAYSGWGVMLKV